MYSCPGETSTGTICPGSLVANANSPGAPIARYSVIKIDPPPATRFKTPKRPPPPANCVCVVIWMEAPIQESSPASEMTVSLGSRTNSRTGMVVPVMRLCIAVSYVVVTRSEGFCSALRFYEITEVVPSPNHQHQAGYFRCASCVHYSEVESEERNARRYTFRGEFRVPVLIVSGHNCEARFTHRSAE
jgi:hypothetical protein